jgi:hypothetical protein
MGVALATEVRGTLIVSSVTMLRERGLLERYRGAVSPDLRDRILEVTAASWVPVGYIVAHYEACDRFDFTTTELIALGREFTQKLHRPIIEVVLRLAGAAGVTPWTLAEQLPRIWDRMYRGGSVEATKLGPKEARIDIRGFPCAHIRYSRVAWRGVLLGGTELFSQRAFVAEIPSRCNSTSLAYRVSWV